MGQTGGARERGEEARSCQIAACAVVALLLVLPLSVHSESLSESNSATAHVAAPSAEDGGPRRWEIASDGLDAWGAPSRTAAAVARLAGGTLVSNLGCRAVGLEVWCEIEPIPRGPRGFAKKDMLLPARGPDGSVPTGTNTSAERARKGDYDARGRLPCAQEAGEPMGECSFGVARSGGGDATLVVTFANGFSRQLYFVNGEFTSANATMSGNGTDTEWRVEGDLHVIRVDDQRYEVEVGLVLGE